MPNTNHQLNLLTAEAIALIDQAFPRQRQRSGSGSVYEAFFINVRHLLSLACDALMSGSCNSFPVSLGSNAYSGTRYNLRSGISYRLTRNAVNGLTEIGLLQQVDNGYYDRSSGKGRKTTFQPTPKLCELLAEIDSFPAMQLTVDDLPETILLRETLPNGRKQLKEYADTDQTHAMRDKLNAINRQLLGHWPDLRLTDAGFEQLRTELSIQLDRQPVNFSRRSLHRVFNEGSFEHGGRYYNGWWQNVPSRYRPYITIDGQPTVEVDYCTLNPTIAYALCGADSGNADLYERVLDRPLSPEERQIVKRAFNAMLMAGKRLTHAPDGIYPSVLGLKWCELRDLIIKAHQPIAHMFFTGIGLSLQYEDSRLAENIMLHFANNGIPVLPIHDSFLIFHSLADELEELMCRLFFEQFGKHISTKRVPMIEQPSFVSEEYSQWSDRNEKWLRIK